MHNPHDRSGRNLETSADPELAVVLPAIAGPAGEFRHRQHIHLAFWAVRRYGMPAATDRVCDWIRHLAAYQRAPQKYHHTVSRAWMELVAHHVAEDGLSRIAAGARPRGSAEPPDGDFDAFTGRHPALLDKRLLSRHYRSATLASTRARQSWVEPDLVPFPWWPGKDSIDG